MMIIMIIIIIIQQLEGTQVTQMYVHKHWNK